MGRVFLAERADGGFQQQCALEVMRWEMASDSTKARAWLHRELGVAGG